MPRATGVSRSRNARRRVSALLAAAAAAALSGCAANQAPPFDPARYEIVDLTHAFNAETIYWPTSPTIFHLDTLSRGVTPGGFFYSANAFSAPEHGGTHLDAPIHFDEQGLSAEAIPLEQLVAPAVVIDIASQAERDPDYRLTRQDVLDFEGRHGAIGPGTIVVLRTGWSERWPDRVRYLGDDTPGDASNLHFPSYGEEAAQLLVKERKVAALGVDVASIDYGQSRDYLVHRVAASHQVPGLENLAHLERLPPRGAIVVALPMKIEGGSGGPVRAIALIPKAAARP